MPDLAKSLYGDVTAISRRFHGLGGGSVSNDASNEENVRNARNARNVKCAKSRNQHGVAVGDREKSRAMSGNR